MMSLETVVARMLTLEKSYFALQERYLTLLHQHNELIKERAALNSLKERYEDECG